ncbi:hypothetical protein [Cohaesibacter gelatinilyticus]|uniref:Uncharacterized protein n=1 Tax=Cohaesibacter gelatinilyticus TaxID=372072 RepID=A0A285N8Z6_9HYPH|nr:hypothetical protein [Cohaesibacter gelatinilyticus]SNZ05768.1 hypothetical protein SAMN06265368_0201 [Cohaesibacter gelatinilyticus]HAT87430.1 hypothetical protein [Hyphomicrobiales bacterium]
MFPDNLSSSKFARRNFIYVSLLIFLCFGAIIDEFFGLWNAYNLTWNDAVQMIGVIILTLLWQQADATALRIRPSYTSKFLTVIFSPLGMAVYLFQSRTWKSALLTYLVFCGGIFLVFGLFSVALSWLF